VTQEVAWTVQAVTALVQAIAIIVLLVVTAWYANETRRYRKIAGEQLAELRAQRPRRPRFELSDPVQFPNQTFNRLPPLAPSSGTLYRIKVSNVGEATAFGASVQVTESAPAIRSGLPTPLLITDDRATPPSRYFLLRPGETSARYVDFVHTLADHPGTVFLATPLTDWDGNLQGADFKIELTVSATTDSDPVTVTYLVTLENGNLYVVRSEFE